MMCCTFIIFHLCVLLLRMYYFITKGSGKRTAKKREKFCEITRKKVLPNFMFSKTRKFTETPR